MDRKRNAWFLVIGLLAAGIALAQMGFSSDGVTFPDGSVQTTASGTEYRVIGVTTATTDGSAAAIDGNGVAVTGIAALNQMCVNEFGPASRAAFSNEQLAPSIEPSEITDSGWVRPTDVRVTHDPDIATGTDWYAIDGPSGAAGALSTNAVSAARAIDCYRFTQGSSTYAGLYRSVNGSVFSAFCTNPNLGVACSARVQIPVYPSTQ